MLLLSHPLARRLPGEPVVVDPGGEVAPRSLDGGFVHPETRQRESGHRGLLLPSRRGLPAQHRALGSSFLTPITFSSESMKCGGGFGGIGGSGELWWDGVGGGGLRGKVVGAADLGAGSGCGLAAGRTLGFVGLRLGL